MVIHRSDRVAEVLRSDASLIEVFVAASPVFERLRNPRLAKVIGRLATVEQAARLAGVDPDLLTGRLNRALTGVLEPTDSTAPESQKLPVVPLKVAADPNERNDMSRADIGAPEALSSISAEFVVELDVREALRDGQEPFGLIMAARREVPPGGALRLRAIFEPVPLYAVMAKQGFDHWTEELAADDWLVSFYPAVSAGAASPPHRAAPPYTQAVEEDVVVLDVRGMEPPEPMVRTLAALEELPPGRTLLQINERVPQFLLPRLDELGFTYEVREQNDALIRVFIRRRAIS